MQRQRNTKPLNASRPIAHLCVIEDLNMLNNRQRNTKPLNASRPIAHLIEDLLNNFNISS